MEFVGPKGHVAYKGNGKFIITDKKTKSVHEISPTSLRLFCGGTGVAPHLSIVRMIAMESEAGFKCLPHVSMLYGSKNEQGILMWDELRELETSLGASNRFSLHLTLDNESLGWNGGVGYIDVEMMQAHAPPIEGALLLVCGPRPMVQLCHDSATTLGYVCLYKGKTSAAYRS